MADSAKTSRQTTARIVWDTADKYLRNIVDEEDYGDYILPFTVLRRLECMLAYSKDDVIKYVNAFAGMPQHLIDIAVKDKFRLGFYNVSPLNLATIASVDDNVDKSLKSYIDGFSAILPISGFRSTSTVGRRSSPTPTVCSSCQALLHVAPRARSTQRHGHGRCLRGCHVPRFQ